MYYVEENTVTLST